MWPHCKHVITRMHMRSADKVGVEEHDPMNAIGRALKSDALTMRDTFRP